MSSEIRGEREREREMAMNNDLKREERRRRIVERGADRMALITGRLSSLVPSTPPPSPSSSSAPYNDHIHEAGSENKKITKDVSQEEKDCNIGSQIESQQFHEYKRNLQEPSSESLPTLKIKHHPKFFSSKRLNFSIIASETTRIFCALIVAFLVVLSYVDYPLFGINIVRSESVVASRPLYILILTDVTIVIARLHLENRRALEDGGGGGGEEEEVLQIRDDGHNWTQALKFLERGLVVYQAIRGIFIDCSVYAVVVICGLSLV